MTDEKDNLADALAALAAGQHTEPEDEVEGDADRHVEHNTAHVEPAMEAGPGAVAPVTPLPAGPKVAGSSMTPVAKKVVPVGASVGGNGGR